MQLESSFVIQSSHLQYLFKIAQESDVPLRQQMKVKYVLKLLITLTKVEWKSSFFFYFINLLFFR